MFDFISVPLGYVMQFLYNIVNNYALAIFLFTVLTRILLLPLSIKQQKSQASMARITPKINAVKEKYKSDKARQSEEMQKIYKEEGYSPTAGCLPLLIQLPILFGLVGVIYRPLTYILSVPGNVIAAATKAAEALKISGNMIEINIINQYAQVKDQLPMLHPYPIESLDFKLFGFIDLSGLPSISEVSWLWLIPIFAGLSQIALSWITARLAKQNGQAGAGMGMMMVMSLVSVYFGFTLPAGAGFYWICSSLIAIVQTIVLNTWYSPLRMSAKSEFSAARKRLTAEKEIKARAGR